MRMHAGAIPDATIVARLERPAGMMTLQGARRRGRVVPKRETTRPRCTGQVGRRSRSEWAVPIVDAQRRSFRRREQHAVDGAIRRDDASNGRQPLAMRDGLLETLTMTTRARRSDDGHDGGHPQQRAKP